jgi:Zn-dependent M32 family carboxypeptidase
MAKSSTKAQQAWETGRSAADNEYVRRLIEDAELRENIKTAFESGKRAYDRLSNGTGPAKALMDDKKVHKELRNAAASLREASDQLRGKRDSHTFRNLVMIAIVGSILALVLSEDLRKAVLDRLFGAEEEFEYTSTTTAAPAPEAAATNSGD